MKYLIIAAAFLIVISFAIGICVYPIMPEKMISHWDGNGNPNGYSNTFEGVFILPIIMVFALLLLYFIPLIDPLRKNIKKFERYYHIFLLILTGFLFYVYILTLIVNLGIKINISQFILPGFSVLLFYLGILMENAKRNWTIGIRTPWTVSSEKVWAKTHKLGAKIMKVLAFIALGGIFFGNAGIFFFILPLIASMIYLVVYSFVLFKKEKKH